MRYMKWIGLVAVILLVGSCFLPWVIITSKNIHLNINLSSEYYLLSKDTELSLNSIDGENEFFGYKKTPLKYTTSDDSVIQIKNIIENHLDQIIFDEPFLYPKPNSYHYPKFSDLKLFQLIILIWT